MYKFKTTEYVGLQLAIDNKPVADASSTTTVTSSTSPEVSRATAEVTPSIVEPSINSREGGDLATELELTKIEMLENFVNFLENWVINNRPVISLLHRGKTTGDLIIDFQRIILFSKEHPEIQFSIKVNLLLEELNRVSKDVEDKRHILNVLRLFLIELFQSKLDEYHPATIKVGCTKHFNLLLEYTGVREKFAHHHHIEASLMDVVNCVRQLRGAHRQTVNFTPVAISRKITLSKDFELDAVEAKEEFLQNLQKHIKKPLNQCSRLQRMFNDKTSEQIVDEVNLIIRSCREEPEFFELIDDLTKYLSSITSDMHTLTIHDVYFLIRLYLVAIKINLAESDTTKRVDVSDFFVELLGNYPASGSTILGYPWYKESRINLIAEKLSELLQASATLAERTTLRAASSRFFIAVVPGGPPAVVPRELSAAASLTG